MNRTGKYNISQLIFASWKNRCGNVNSTQDLLAWIANQNRNTYVNIKECSIYESDFWTYDQKLGKITNKKNAFFSIVGMQMYEDASFLCEQPIIYQPEIGYLGIICKVCNGVLNFLVQAKVEPGNINFVQLSPTIQATKSNFMQAHGGALPTYFEYFEKADKYQVLYDQIQSEQASRFYKKRNRNIILLIHEDIPVFSNYRWMTLGQIKEFMNIDNLVNMDLRTVLSGIPLLTEYSRNSPNGMIDFFGDKSLYYSLFTQNLQENLPSVFQRLNDYKMYKDVTTTEIPLYQLQEWAVDDYGITCKNDADFCVRYYDIEISGREVQKWTQPLVKATGSATFGLISQVQDGIRKFLIQFKPEIGSFDQIEIGPSIQWEPCHKAHEDNIVDRYFRELMDDADSILKDVVLSEEGGRFYQEQNRNIIVNLPNENILKLDHMCSKFYMWVDYGTLSYLIQMNNCLNIQLRNLLSLIDI